MSAIKKAENIFATVLNQNKINMEELLILEKTIIIILLGLAENNSNQLGTMFLIGYLSLHIQCNLIEQKIIVKYVCMYTLK